MRATLLINPARHRSLSQASSLFPNLATMAAFDPGTCEFRLLVPEAREGCEDAMREIIERLEPRVLGLIRLHLPFGEDPADVAQEVFIKLFRKLHLYRQDAPLWNWVSRLTVNTCIDLIRARQRRPAVRWSDLTQREQDLLLDQESHPSPPEAVDIDAAGIVEKLLAALGPEERFLIRELELNEKTPQELAETTGWTSGNVRIKAFRARKKLQKLYRKLEDSATRSLSTQTPAP